MNLHFLQKKHHFGIRKFSIGVVSVALAISFSVAGGQVAAAQEASQTPVSSQQMSQAVTEEPGQEPVYNEAVQQATVIAGTPSTDDALTPDVQTLQQDSVAPQNTTTQANQSPATSQLQTGTEEKVNDPNVGTETPQSVIATPSKTVTESAPVTETFSVESAPTDQLAKEVVQPVLRSVSMARSVAANEVAKLPLDDQGELMTSVNGKTVQQFQVVYSDGSSQIVPATTQPTTSQTREAVAQQVASLKDDFAAVTYESLYPYLGHQESFLEKNALETAIRKENGGNALSADQMQSLKQIAYMDMLDMRESFERVKAKIEATLTGIFEKSSQVNVEDIRRNKEKILAGLSYLDRQYSFEFGQHQAQDLILYHPQVFGGGGTPLNTLSILNTLTYRDLTLGQSATTYQTKLAPITNQADIFSFVEKGVSLFEPGKTGEQWFKENSKAHLAESQSPYGNSSLYQKLKSNVRLNNHFIPLLTLPTDLVYAISTSNTVNYGLTESYVRSGDQTGLATFKANLQSYADDQESFLKFWHRISQNRDILANHEPIIVVDSPQKLGTATQRVQELYSPKYGSGVLEGVEKFIKPLSLYANFLQADGQANGKTSINLFLKKSLSEAGQSVYTHELTHMFDKNVWLNGYDRRAGQLQEVFARGMFESMDVAKTPYQDPSFIINTAYRMGDNRTQNASPDRFQTSDDLKTYMQGILDVLYTLDYAEAQSILGQIPEDRAVLLNQLNLVASANGGQTDQAQPISRDLAAGLQSVHDFVDNQLISGRYKFDGLNTTGTARTNSYYTIPLFEPIYAGLQNNAGTVGDISFRRNAYDILGEYGYEKGMVAYVSGQYVNDQAALNAIMPEYGGDLATFKKAMFDRRIAKVTELKSTSVASDFAAIQSLMDVAIAKDLQQMKHNATNRVALSTRVSAVQELKKSIFQAYLKDTDDFRSSIYQEVQARDLYVTQGDEQSRDGQGTEANPYHSLTYALSQARDGDTIKLVSDVQHRQETPFLINKAVTIDGQGHRLTFRGPNVELGNDVTFANMTLNMIVDASQQATIYANGYHLTFDRVSTTISQAQSNLRPSLVAGSRTGDPAGSHGQITITNGSSDTRFNTIYAGNADSTSSVPVTISILSDFVNADQGIKLSGVNGELVEGPVSVISKSSSLKSIDGSASLDNTVTIDTARVYGLNLQNIQSLSLVNRADVTLSEQVTEISTGVELASGTQLNIANDPVTLGNLSGQGKVIVPATASLVVTGSIEGTVEVLVRGFEHNLSPHVDKVFVTAEGGFADTVRIDLESQSDRFSLNNEGIAYRLIEPTQTPQDIQIQLRFKEGERVVKEESLTLPAGSSVTDLADRLPRPALGHYEISSSFDQTQLNNLQTSQTIDIPLELVTPALPVIVFDKNNITSFEVVTPPTKKVYRPADSVDLADLQVKLVDNQGLSRTISSDQFGEYGVELVPVTLTPQVTSLQVRKDNHELTIPIQVIPWKADVYSVHVGDKHVYEIDDSLPTVEAALLAKVQVDAQAGSVEKSLVNPLPTTLGEHSVPVLVKYDDGSQKRVFVQVVVQHTANGEGVTHELPQGVLPPLETAKGEGVTHELPQGVLSPLETAKGEGVTHELPQGVLPPLETAKGEGVTHELPQGVLPPLETAKGEGVTHELPQGVLSPLETAKGEGVTHELPEGVLPPLETAKGEGVTHELPQGVLPPLETAKGEGVTHELPQGVLPPLETAKGEGVTHELPQGVLPPLETAKGEGVTHELPQGVLPPLETAKGEGVTHELPQGVLPPLETAKGEGVTHELPQGILPPLETAKGEGVTHELPQGVLPPLETAKGEGVTHELPQGVLPPLETAKGESLLFDRPILTVDEMVKRLTTGQSVPKGILVDFENSSNPAAEEKVAPIFSVRSRIGTNGQLPATGDKNNNLALLGILSAICQFIFLKVRRKSDLAIFTDGKNK